MAFLIPSCNVFYLLTQEKCCFSFSIVSVMLKRIYPTCQRPPLSLAESGGFLTGCLRQTESGGTVGGEGDLQRVVDGEDFSRP